MEVAWGWLEGGLKVALRSHEGGFEVPSRWLATRFEVAPMSHWGGFRGA